MTSNKNINNHSKSNHNNKNSQINKNNIPGRPAKSNVAAHNEHSVDTRELVSVKAGQSLYDEAC